MSFMLTRLKRYCVRESMRQTEVATGGEFQHIPSDGSPKGLVAPVAIGSGAHCVGSVCRGLANLGACDGPPR
jgi:hypothetical protein